MNFITYYYTSIHQYSASFRFISNAVIYCSHGHRKLCAAVICMTAVLFSLSYRYEIIQV